MKALTFNPVTDTFSIRDLPIPVPGPGDVCVKVAACGLNPVDAKIKRWKTMAPDMDADWTPGLDVSGEIVKVGARVANWKVGDRVLYHGNMLRPHGGLAEYAIHKAETLIPHPPVSSALAAATPCAAWTAWRALHHKLRLEPGHSILITGGSGGVGGFAIQLARDLGAEPIITTCSAKNHAYVLSLGATHAIDYRTENVVARVREITGGKGVDRALDTVGPDEDLLVAEALGFEGEMVEIVDVVRPEKYREVFLRGLSFHQLSLGAGHRAGMEAEARMVRAGTACSEMLAEGRLTVPVLRMIPLEEAGARLVEILQGRSVGKTVVVF
ncbi:zinc-binding dehydrogenase [Tepidimonas sp.]|uniref:zinc-binding dehydrogenase n=1 Tax=Tepidimonas sp. TaxID=2002775 RepID=UPI00391BD567